MANYFSKELEKMRIYTRSGDSGTTSLIYGKRVKKNNLRVEAYGTCDEANSMIGLALSYIEDEEWKDKDTFIQYLRRVQTILFHVGSELSTPEDREVHWKLAQNHIDELEQLIDKWNAELTPLTNFILPSGHQGAAALHVARTMIRRAERVVVSLMDEEVEVDPLVMAYLNRLSDFLYVAARYCNMKLGRKDIPLVTDN